MSVPVPLGEGTPPPTAGPGPGVAAKGSISEDGVPLKLGSPLRKSLNNLNASDADKLLIKSPRVLAPDPRPLNMFPTNPRKLKSYSDLGFLKLVNASNCFCAASACAAVTCGC